MNEADRPGPSIKTEDSNSDGELISRYEVVPYAETANDGDLYAFRAGLPPPPQAPAPAQQRLSGRKQTALMAGVFALALLLVILIVLVISGRKEPAPPFIDLGANQIASAGLGGRLIAKWDGKAEYELHIDPLVPQQVASFSEMAANPPRPLSVNLRLKDTSGSVVCQKEVVFPFNPAAEANPEQTRSLLPQETIDGDTVQNLAGADGQIDEIVVFGQLPCPLKSYKRLTSWDLLSSFPPVADQEDWMRHEQGVAADLRRRAAEARAKSLIPRSRPLPEPIEGDDVIVFDNPSKGTVETKTGRLFYVGKDGLRRRASGWQIFPAAIHFRCDTKAECVLTRSDAAMSLQARLVR